MSARVAVRVVLGVVERELRLPVEPLAEPAVLDLGEMPDQPEQRLSDRVDSSGRFAAQREPGGRRARTNP